MARKKSDESFAVQERARRLTAILQGAFSGSQKPLEDIPKKNGESRVVPDRPQGDSLKPREQADCAVFVVLKSFDGAGWRGRDEFQDFEDEGGKGENVARCVVATVGVGVLAKDDVFVSMHDLDAPMIAIDAQQCLWRGGGGQAGDEVDDLMLRRLPLAVLFDLAPPSDAADLPDRRPLVLNAGGFGRQHVDHAPLDAPMRLFDAAIP